MITAVNSSAVEWVKAAITESLPQPWAEWPGGWPNEVESALIDAVLSIRANYGSSSSTGVRGAVRRYRDDVGGGALNDLTRLAAYSPDQLETVLKNQQKTSGVSKAQAIVEAAHALVSAGVTKAEHVSPEEHLSAYTRVHGLGKVTWEYFTMLLGHPGIKADTWITRWVSDAVGADRQLSSDHAHALLKRAAAELGIGADSDLPNLTQLDHAIWNVARTT
jgi:hypothetical protein